MQDSPVTERSVMIEHSPEGGSRVELEDPSHTELIALGMICVTIVLILRSRRGRRA